MEKLLKTLYFVAGAACVAYYFVLWHASRLGLSMSWIWPVAGVVLIACGLLCGHPAVPRWLSGAWRTLVCLGLAALLALEGLVISGMSATAPANLDYLIVLGARVDPDGPSPALNRRLNAVMACLPDHPNARIIATGGKGVDEPSSEARCIHDELVRRGVDPGRILMEEASRNTAENLRNAMAMMDDPAATVGIITNNYHIWRSVRLAHKAGLQNAYGIAAEYTGHTKFHYMIREAACIVVEYLRGNL